MSKKLTTAMEIWRNGFWSAFWMMVAWDSTADALGDEYGFSLFWHLAVAAMSALLFVHFFQIAAEEVTP